MVVSTRGPVYRYSTGRTKRSLQWPWLAAGRLPNVIVLYSVALLPALGLTPCSFTSAQQSFAVKRSQSERVGVRKLSNVNAGMKTV